MSFAKRFAEVKRLWIDAHRMKRIKHLEKRLCKAVSRFLGENIVCVTGYGKAGKGDAKK